MSRAILVFVLSSIALGYFGACSPTEFSHIDSAPCQGSSVQCVKTCADGNCFDQFVVNETVGRGKVDIVIVNDNSGSMSTEQKKMAERFPTFLQSMGSLDYRIGIVTTDISNSYAKVPSNNNAPGPYNGNGAYQDGNLLNFINGQSYLDPSMGSLAALNDMFGKNISRAETKTCEQSGYTQCPAGDERGIYALNLVVDRFASTFFREGADFAAIILSDEDERSLSDSRSVRKQPEFSASQTQEDQWLISSYPLEPYDKPETLISRFKTRFPGKTMTGHSIIVKPGDKACRDIQTGQGSNPYVRGVEGYTYAKFSQLTGGSIGSICASDYGAQLQEIGYSLQVPTISLVCRPNSAADVKVELSSNAGNKPFTVDLDRQTVEFPQSLPPETQIRVSYSCPTVK